MSDQNSTASLGKTLKKFLYFLKSKNKINVLWLILIIVITSITPSVDSILLQNIVDQIELYSDNDLKNIDLASQIFKWVVIYAIWWEGLNFTWRVYDYAYLKIMPKIKAQVIDEFYDYVQYHDYKFFQNTLAGDISNRITEASRSLEMIFAYANEKILRQLFILLFALVTLFTVHSYVAIIFLVWMIVFVSTSLYFSKTINDYSTIYGKDKALVSGRIVDSIVNISAIRMFASHRYERKNLSCYTDRAVTSDQNMQWFMLKLRYVLGLSCTIMITSMIYFIIKLRGNLEISTGQSILIITLCVAVMENIWDLTQTFGDLFEQIGSFNQSMTLLGEYKVKDKNNADKLIISKPSIEFKNVTFYYENNNNKFEKQNITIKPYETIGLIGFSGSGKTTFANLISRLYDVNDGSILIDNVDISKVSQDSLRRNISIIPQEPILFHRTILENIRYGNPESTESEVHEAAKKAHIHDFIMGLNKGYDTTCGERGNNFSGGQRQRIIIARAFLKNAPILILDEATNALDSYTEQLIQKSLQELMKDKTVLIIAHRLSTLSFTDRIFVFDKGSIVEAGSSTELQKNGDMYKRLWNNAVI